MTANLLIYGGLVVVAIVAGAVAGGLTAWKLKRQQATVISPKDEPVIDEFIDAAIDMESVRWQESHDLPPEAAALMSARLKSLIKLSAEKGWL